MTECGECASSDNVIAPWPCGSWKFFSHMRGSYERMPKPTYKDIRLARTGAEATRNTHRIIGVRSATAHQEVSKSVSAKSRQIKSGPPLFWQGTLLEGMGS